MVLSRVLWFDFLHHVLTPIFFPSFYWWQVRDWAETDPFTKSNYVDGLFGEFRAHIGETDTQLNAVARACGAKYKVAPAKANERLFEKVNCLLFFVSLSCSVENGHVIHCLGR